MFYLACKYFWATNVGHLQQSSSAFQNPQWEWKPLLVGRQAGWQKPRCHFPEIFSAFFKIFQKGCLAIATLKQTFTFFGRDFALFNTFTWQNPYQKNESWFQSSDGQPALLIIVKSFKKVGKVLICRVAETQVPFS